MKELKEPTFKEMADAVIKKHRERVSKIKAASYPTKKELELLRTIEVGVLGVGGKMFNQLCRLEKKGYLFSGWALFGIGFWKTEKGSEIVKYDIK